MPSLKSVKSDENGASSPTNRKAEYTNLMIRKDTAEKVRQGCKIMGGYILQHQKLRVRISQDTFINALVEQYITDAKKQR